MPKPAATTAPPKLGGGLRRILIALAQRPGLTNRQLSSASGTFSTYLSQARSSGWLLDEGDRRFITDEGLAALGEYEPLPEGPALLDYWLRELGGGLARLLQALAGRLPPEPHERGTRGSRRSVA